MSESLKAISICCFPFRY